MSNEHTASGPYHLSMLRSIVEAATTVVDGVADGQLAESTPCDEWDVRALLGHLVVTVRMFAIAADKGHIPQEDATALAGNILGTDFHAAWKDASRQILLAFEPPEVLGKVLALPFGDTPGDMALDLAVLEVGIHAADLAHATRQQIADQKAYASVHGILRARMTDAWRAPGILNDEQPAPPEADIIDELLAYAGRRTKPAASPSR